jgi:hypothetical protein
VELLSLSPFRRHRAELSAWAVAFKDSLVAVAARSILTKVLHFASSMKDAL